MKINITNKQREFILKAIWNISSLYDFDISENEFLESHNITQKDLKKETEQLRGQLKKDYGLIDKWGLIK